MHFKNTNSFIILFAFILFSISKLCAQDTAKLVINSFFVKASYIFNQEPAIVSGSLNYKRRVSNSNLFIGLGLQTFQKIDEIFDPQMTKGIPIELTYSFFKNKSHLETGLSYTMLFVKRKIGDQYLVNLGYAFENFNKRGINIKLGISPGFVGQSHLEGFKKVYRLYFMFQTYLGLGYSF